MAGLMLSNRPKPGVPTTVAALPVTFTSTRSPAPAAAVVSAVCCPKRPFRIEACVAYHCTPRVTGPISEYNHYVSTSVK